MQRILLLWLVLLALSLFSPSLLFAEDVSESELITDQALDKPESEEATELGTIVVTANRFAEPLDLVPNSLTVIDKEEIVDQDVFTVGDLLRDSPGVQVISLGSPGEDLDIRLRGTDRDETLVLIDGIKLNIPSNDRTHLSPISPGAVERIEILRGSQSILYGSDAIGGVVQFFSRKGPPHKGHKWSFDFSGGNLQTFRETATASGGSDTISYFFNYTRTDQKGRFDRDRYRANAFSTNAQFRLSEEGTLSVYANYWQTSQQLPTEFLVAPGAVVDPAVPPATLYLYINDVAHREAFRHYTADKIAYNHQLFDWWLADFSYAFSYFDEKDAASNRNTTGQTTPLGVQLTPSSYVNKVRSYRHDFLMKHNFFPLDTKKFTNIVTLGFEFEYEDVKIRGNNFPGDTPPPAGAIGPIPPNQPFPSGGEKGNRENYAVFVQNNFSFNDALVINAGFRYDRNTTFDDEWSPRAAISYTFKSVGTKLKASYSEGFHAPTVVDFYLARQLGINRNLRPETTQSYEAGIEQKLWGDRIRAEVTYFYIDFDNLITGFQNINDAYSWGIESSLHVKPLDWLGFGGNYTYTKAIDESNGNVPLPNRSRHVWYGYISAKPIKGFTARLDFNYVGAQLEEFILVDNTGVPITGSFVNAATYTMRKNPGYYKLDLALAYEIFRKSPYKYFRQLRVHTKFNNITNKRYDQRYGFPSPGFTFLSGVEAVF